MSCSSRGKWSAVGSLVSAPVRGYYYPGHIKATKRSVDGSSLPIYSVAFSDPLDSLEEPDDKGLILDFTAEQLIGRGFEPITRTLLSENQKVFITYRGREVSARVDKHDTTLDEVSLVLDSEPYRMTVRLHEIRLLPSRKSGRIQEHPDYSLLANGRRSPDQEPVNQAGTKPKSSGGRRRTTSSSSLLLPESSDSVVSQSSGTIHPASARIDVPSMPSGRKRRPSNSNVMDECAAALVLMSLSASPRSPTFFTEQPSSSKIYKCTWPQCVHQTLSCSDIEKHVREDHLRKLNEENDEEMSGEEEFYYTEVDANERNGWKHPAASVSTSFTHSSGPESPVSLSEDAASTSSGSVGMTNGDNSMDSSPPSPITNNNSFFKSNSAFVSAYCPHLEDHEYNRRPDPAGISILGKGNNRVSKKNLANSPSILSSGVTSHPINIPNMDQNENQPLTMSASFGGFSGSSSLSSGFGSYNSFGSSFSPVSPPRSSGSLSSSLSSASNKYLRISAGRTNSSGTTILQNGALNRTSPTKRVRGETRKCRKIYGMEKKEAWCTQCKWKKACTRFID